jgi:hypothetical protein
MIHDLHGWRSAAGKNVYELVQNFKCFCSSYPTISVSSLTEKWLLHPASGEQNMIQNFSLIVYCLPKISIFFIRGHYLIIS